MVLPPIETKAGLILPGHPLFEDYLYSAFPPNWRDLAYHNPDFCFVARSGTGILEAVTHKEMQEYIEGGEYDQWMEECNDGNED